MVQKSCFFFVLKMVFVSVVSSCCQQCISCNIHWGCIALMFCAVGKCSRSEALCAKYLLRGPVCHCCCGLSRQPCLTGRTWGALLDRVQQSQGFSKSSSEALCANIFVLINAPLCGCQSVCVCPKRIILIVWVSEAKLLLGCYVFCIAGYCL